MSIANTILKLESQGDLTRYVPARTLRPARRCLFMTQRMHQKLNDPGSAVNLLVGRGWIEAEMTAWTMGDYLFDNGRGGPGFIKRLEAPPPEVWEIRVTFPAPFVRIFGRFAAPDNFIATDMHTRDYLGPKGSSAWKDACDLCVSDWRQLFPMYPPHSGKVVSDYITEDCDDFPLP